MQKTLYIFDFDDTLFTTNNRIYLLDPQSLAPIKSLTSSEYAAYEYADLADYIFSYDDFHSVVGASPIEEIHEILHKISHEPDIYILTARSKANIPSITSALLEHGHKALPILSADFFHGSNTAEKKRSAIDFLLSNNSYDCVEFYDDSIFNLEAVKGLRSHHQSVEFRLLLVNSKKV